MYHLLCKQVTLLFLVFLFSIKSFAQKEQYRLERDEMPYYFGATLGINSGSLSASKSDKFLKDDSILVAEPATTGGLSIGIHATIKLSKRWEFRFSPSIILGGARYFNYTLGSKQPYEDANQAFTLPTTLVSFPLSFKFNSDRIDNFRTYLLIGGKMDINLSGTSKGTGGGNQDDYIRLKKYSYGAELGIGFNFFTRWVTISPEIKVSYGLNDIHDRNPNLKYSSIFNDIKPRMIIFSVFFEQ